MLIDPIGAGGAVTITLYLTWKELLPRLRNGNARTAGGQPIEAWEGKMRETVRAEVRDALEPVVEVLRDIRRFAEEQSRDVAVMAEVARAELKAARTTYTGPRQQGGG